MKRDEPVDDYAVTVVLDEAAARGAELPKPTGETLTGDYVQAIEAALRRDRQR
jgi:hypothetical protein